MVKAALVADDLPVAEDLTVLMLRVVLMLHVEIRKAIARDDQQQNRLQFGSASGMRPLAGTLRFFQSAVMLKSGVTGRAKHQCRSSFV